MKKIKDDGKLTLNTETLKNLTAEEIDKAVGGATTVIELTLHRSEVNCSICDACNRR